MYTLIHPLLPSSNRYPSPTHLTPPPLIHTPHPQVLRTEYYQVRSQTGRQGAEQEAELSSLREKLKVYEQLEVEMDVAIMNTGSIGKTIDLLRYEQLEV